MRTRGNLAALVVGLALVLAGCGHEAGPTPNGAAEDPGLRGLRIKLAALATDQCFADPARQLPKGCEKYVTQVGGTVGAIEKSAAGLPQVPQQAAQVRKAVATYRDEGCGEIATPGGVCTQALTDIGSVLGRIRAGLGTQPASP